MRAWMGNVLPAGQVVLVGCDRERCCTHVMCARGMAKKRYNLKDVQSAVGPETVLAQQDDGVGVSSWQRTTCKSLSGK